MEAGVVEGVGGGEVPDGNGEGLECSHDIFHFCTKLECGMRSRDCTWWDDDTITGAMMYGILYYTHFF